MLREGLGEHGPDRSVEGACMGAGRGHVSRNSSVALGFEEQLKGEKL